MAAKKFYQLWLLGLGLKLAISAWLPLFSDETYYWVWSHNLQLSYYDHPPMIAWLIRLGHFLEPYGNMVRWPAVVFAHCTLIVWFFLLKGRFAEEKLKFWFALAFFTPMTGMGSLILTPDLPLVFFWSTALLAMDRAMTEKKPVWYLLLGAALGLGFCAKYHTVLFIPLLFLWIAWKKLWREVMWKYVPFTVLLGLIFCSPVLVWNAQNDWVSFKFQLDHGLGDSQWKPKYTWRYLYGQAALLFPVVIYFALKAKNLQKLSWLPVFTWGPLTFFLFSSFRGKVEANWPSIAYPSIVVLALLGSSSAALTARWVRWTVAAWIAAAAVVCSHIVHPWLPFNHKKLKTYELVKYRPFAKIAESYKPFYAPTFQLASKIWYEQKVPTYKLKGMGRFDFYDSLENSVPAGKTYFFAAEKWNQLPAWARERKHKIVNRIPIDQEYTLFEVRVP